jgi:hypothetical protein
VLGQLDELEEVDQWAIRVALGLAEGRASELPAVSNATLRRSPHRPKVSVSLSSPMT